jgi:hypothetical protein
VARRRGPDGGKPGRAVFGGDTKWACGMAFLQMLKRLSPSRHIEVPPEVLRGLQATFPRGPGALGQFAGRPCGAVLVASVSG